ncbi:hypothetical protein Pcinc_026697 [Petrolisthes cinctipes]|uniref:Uncharacterized protein n=1 Tax=Petrolisthes cinctipes TaxID=88211 RepID=A0AAE1F613_PETCI|nr:hypothetical protein Pcinc_026697 [Petrolisthes cinctipes]
MKQKENRTDRKQTKENRNNETETQIKSMVKDANRVDPMTKFKATSAMPHKNHTKTPSGLTMPVKTVLVYIDIL